MNTIIWRTGLFPVLVLGLGLMGWDSSSAQSTVLAPQMIVRPVASGFLGACRSGAHLQALRAHFAAGETSQAQAMIQNQDCMLLPQDGQFRVLAVRDGLVEIVSFFSRSRTGYWALMASLKPVQ